MAQNTAREIWSWSNFSIWEHSTGYRRFALWDGGTNLCWCESRSDAIRLGEALAYVAMNHKQLAELEPEPMAEAPCPTR